MNISLSPKKIYFILSLILLTFCVKTYFSNSNRNTLTWKELLDQKKVHFTSVVDAYNNFASSNTVTKEDRKDFNYWYNRYQYQVDEKGFVISDDAIFFALKDYNIPGPNRNISKGEILKKSSIGMTFLENIPNSNSKGDWINIGPFGDPDVRWSATGNGALEMVAFHPTNAAIMYVSSRNGGIWKTTNYGNNWVPITDHLPDPYTRYIDIAKNNPNVLYVAAGDGDTKMWLSKNAGSSWTNISSGLVGNIYEVYIDPVNNSKAIAMSVNDGLFLTENQGVSWSKIKEGKFNNLLLSEDRSIIYTYDKTTRNVNVLKSTDFGKTWTSHPISTTITEATHLHISLHQKNKEEPIVYVYALDDTSKTGYPTKYIGLFKSTDGANNFTEIKNPNYAYPNGPVPLKMGDLTPLEGDSYGGVNPFLLTTWASTFYVSPVNSNHMITQSTKMWGTQDEGKSWEFKPSYGGSNWADMRFINHNITKDTLYFCNDGGVFSIAEKDMFPKDSDIPTGKTRIDYMISKVQLKNGDICVTEGEQFGVSSYTKDVYSHGGQDIGQIFHRNGRLSHVASADVYRGNIKPTNDSIFFTGSIAINLDGKKHLFKNDVTPNHFNPLQLYGYNKSETGIPMRLIRSIAGIDAWEINGFRGENKANTGGHSWDTKHPNSWEFLPVNGTGITEFYMGMFEQSRANKDVAIIGNRQSKKVFITNNLSASSPVWTLLPNAPSEDSYSFATHPLNENLIICSGKKRVYLSIDKGESWLNYSSFPQGTSDIMEILIDKNTSKGVYALTKNSVWYIDETLSNWISFEKRLPRKQNQDMILTHLPNGDNVLYVGKYGRGMWRSPTYNQLQKNLPIADFGMFGGYKNQIYVNELTKLYNLSTNTSSISWEFKNGTDIINIGNKNTPEVKLTTPGFYTVTLTATNANGNDTMVKEAYIKVLPEPHNVCRPGVGENTWYRKFDYFEFNNVKKKLEGSPHYKKLDWVLNLTPSQQVNFDILTWNSDTHYYTKGWIDYNNDGDFDDAGEEVLSSNGKVNNSFTGSFIISNTTLNKNLNFRIAGHVSDTPPTPCLNSGSQYQVVDLSININNKATFTSLNYTDVTQFTAKLSANFNNANNVSQSGFVISPKATTPDITNGMKVSYTNSLKNTDSYNLLLSELTPNTTYNYRGYIIDDLGITYSNEIKSFSTTSFTMPLLEIAAITNNGNNNWNLFGKVQPENNVLQSLVIEYGSNNSFDKEIVLDPTKYPNDKEFSIEKLINLDPTKPSYTIRIRTEVNGSYYYSNAIEIVLNKSICTPNIEETQWWRWMKNISFNNILTTIPDKNGYYDFSSSTIFDVVALQSYPLLMNDSYNGSSYYYFRVYIDYNNDGDFDDNGEFPINEKIEDTYKGNLTIPEITTRNTVLKMRVFYGENQGNACSTKTGQMVDFGLRVNPVSKSNLTATNITIDENSGNAIFEVISNKEVTGGFTVDYTSKNGTAIAGNDYTAVSNTLTFLGSKNEKKTITIPIIDDSLNEVSENFTLEFSNLSAPSMINLPSENPIVTINDNDLASISIMDIFVNENETVATLKTILTNDTSNEFSLDYTTLDDTAIAPVDYEHKTGKINFKGKKGEEQLITIPIINDTTIEGNETFKININNITSSSVTISDSEAKVTIIDDEKARININDVIVNEDAGTAKFTVTLTDTVIGGFTVNYTTNEKTATVNTDFTPVTNTLTFLGTDGEKQYITIPIINDATVEDSETFEVILNDISSTSATIAKSIGKGTINNDDSAAITINDVIVSENDSEAIFTVSLQGQVSNVFTIDYSSKDITASVNNDYEKSNGTLSFSGTNNEQLEIKVPIINDDISEVQETFELILTNSSNSFITVNNTKGIATINDDDTPTLTIQNSIIDEAANKIIFIVTLTSSSVNNSFKVVYNTENVTAMAGQDYEEQQGSLIFEGKKDEQQTISVNIIDDIEIEGSETFKVNLLSTDNNLILIDNASAIGTITDNDIAKLKIEDVTIDENNKTALFTTSLEGNVPGGFTIEYNTIDNTAIAGNDYTVTSGTLIYKGSHNETHSFIIPILNDKVKEGNEYFKVLFSKVSSQFVEISNKEATITIIDDDTSVNVDDFILYPNPTKDVFKVKNTQGKQLKGIYIFDDKSSLVFRRENNLQQIEINVTNLAVGVYFVEFIDENGKKYIKSFLKI